MTSNAIPTQGIVIARGDGGSPEAFTLIAEITDFDGPGGERPDIDVSSLDSLAREYLPGLTDNGDFSCTMNFLPVDAQHVAIRDVDRLETATPRNFRITFTDAGLTTATFAAFVKQYRPSGTVDDRVVANVTMRVTGEITWA
jgi:hypothetical protein